MTKFTGQKHIYNSYITTYTTIRYYVLLVLTKAVLVDNEAADAEVKILRCVIPVVLLI
jgi:hypothetical protein